MEKAWLLSDNSSPTGDSTIKPAQPKKRKVVALSLTALLIWALISPWSRAVRLPLPPDSSDAETATRSFRWDYVAPSKSLQYTPCFSDYFCARLSVPINWNATTDDRADGPSVEIAIIKLPAKVPVTDPRYGGPILLNPGGPGESGVYQVLSDGKSLQTLVDVAEGTESPDAKFFDILSFDPRGVNNTTPRLRCFPDGFNQQTWLLRQPDYGLLWDSESIIGMEWARAEALGRSCSYGEDESGILRYLNTAQVAEDMLQIVEKEGEWRAKEATRLIQEQSTTNKDEIMQRASYKPGQEAIQYWGMSYGTLLGATFAALHPDRIGRMILDGVVDPADHYGGHWLTQLQDSNMIITKFCEYCFRAGPGNCPLYTGSSAEDVESRFTAILMSLRGSPLAVAVTDGNTVSPEIITYGDVHLILLTGMYFPFSFAEGLFDLLLAIESRNGSAPALTNMAVRKQARLVPIECGQDDSNLGGCIPYISGVGASQSISCMDMAGSTSLTRTGFQDYLEELQSQGRWISPSWARNKLACVGYTVHPEWKPDLTFEKQEWANTSHPLLIIGNSHDTVTPVRNARRVSTLFPGSQVLQQDSEGHCSHSTPSLCTAKVIREYFQKGTLPTDGKVCAPETRPFLGCISEDSEDEKECKYVDSEDARLWEAMVDLADPFGLRQE
ncbi:hypothetical protein UCRPA7_3513 [Phaeoacremonium minimum UCRPA7]|uniref:Proteinase n=1 Tax=Phaeoacremonium minimum (strain UCR-PA7) TaxID=1286976 RepID=R8BNS3_PHAM7|nr:hypothetical protein UCRPA7_3513 [Phaeoacremonium minimum UCRPA7]EOO00997.1 hypothetical protein UCRPA7_3513 [Phaeoacremonium minimum UCRPA7]